MSNPPPSLKTKTLARASWSRPLERSFAHGSFLERSLFGEISLIHMDRVTAPLTASMGGRMLTVADDGYAWLQIAPEGNNWWLTAMFDSARRIVQYYFDVTARNVLLGSGDSYFLDMFLDVVLLPGGQVFLLDQDELDDALQSGIISANEHQQAQSLAQQLMDSAPAHLPELKSFCTNCFNSLAPRLLSELPR